MNNEGAFEQRKYPQIHWQLSAVLNFIDTVSDWCGRITSYLFLIMLGFVIYEVVMRFVFRANAFFGPLSGFEPQRLLIIYVVMGGSYALLKGAHIKMDAFYRRFPPKKQALADLVTSVFFFLFCGSLLCGTFLLSYPIFREMEFPFNPLAALLVDPIVPWILTAAFLMFIQGLAKLIRDVVRVRTGEEIT